MRLVAADKPVRAGLIGAGKFGAMFLSQAPHAPGLDVVAIADLNPDGARATCGVVGWDADRVAATAFLDNGAELAGRTDVDVVIEATGDPIAGVTHALAAIAAGKHVVMVNVEADVLAGPALAKRAREADVVYTMAYGDQPALVAELVDWARQCGFNVTAAGKGTKYLPAFHAVTPDTVWDHYGLTSQEAEAAGMNPKMFNSFLDGTKSAIEMAAIANATGLAVPTDGLAFPPCGVDDLAQKLRPAAIGGVLEGDGMVEVVSSLERDGQPVDRDLRWGVYVVIEAPNAYSAACFRQYGLNADETGRFAATYKPFHLIGMELNVSVFRTARDGQATGMPDKFRGDVVAVAKRDLRAGEILDGEGGYTVYGKLVPASASVAKGWLPIGFAKGVRVINPVMAGQTVRRSDLEAIAEGGAAALREETEAMLDPS